MTLELALDTFGDVTLGTDGQMKPQDQVIRDVVEQAVLAEGGTAAPVVHSFVPKWRTRQDSNPRPPDS